MFNCSNVDPIERSRGIWGMCSASGLTEDFVQGVYCYFEKFGGCRTAELSAARKMRFEIESVVVSAFDRPPEYLLQMAIAFARRHDYSARGDSVLHIEIDDEVAKFAPARKGVFTALNEV